MNPRRLHALRIAVVVFALGVLSTLALVWWSIAYVHRAEAQALADRGESVLFEARDLFNEAAMQMAAVTGLFQASDHVTVEEFARFVGDIELIPGLIGIGYVPVVGDAQLDQWLATARQEIPDLSLYEYDADGTPVAVGPHDLHFPVLYLWPDPGVAVGLDLAGNVPLQEELTANLAGGVTVTGFLGDALPEPIGGTDHMLMGKGIVQDGSAVVHDFVVVAADVSVLIDSHVVDANGAVLHWSVSDITDVAGVPQTDPGKWQGMMSLGGRTWLFTLWQDDVGRAFPGQAMISLIIGLAMTVLLALVAFLVIGRIEGRSEVRVLESISDGKDDFLAAVSHRLRTPLTSVVGFSEVLRDSDEMLNDSDRRELVSTIAIQAIELGHLFDNLLIVTREADRTPYVASRVDLAGELRAVLDTAEPARRHKVRVVGADPDLVAAGDPALVRQILRNLLANATDFGDRVEVEVTGRGLVASVVVRDNGPGVPANRVGDIFELYRSRGEVGQPDSMGVGLYVSRRLARRLSGNITYKRSAAWTTFELTLPAMPTEVVIEPIPEVFSAAE
jgi:signal transduction histidine kinase